MEEKNYCNYISSGNSVLLVAPKEELHIINYVGNYTKICIFVCYSPLSGLKKPCWGKGNERSIEEVMVKYYDICNDEI